MAETISFPQPPENKGAIERYYEDALSHIKAGETVWMQRDFDSDGGRVLDVFHRKRHFGFIDQKYTDMLCCAYKTPEDDPQGEPESLTNERVSFEEAVRALQAVLEP